MVEKIREEQMIVKVKDKTGKIPLAKELETRPKKDFSRCEPVEFRHRHWFKTPKEVKSKYYQRNMELMKEKEKNRNRQPVLKRVVDFFRMKFNQGEAKLNKSMRFDELKELEGDSDE